MGECLGNYPKRRWFESFEVENELDNHCNINVSHNYEPASSCLPQSGREYDCLHKAKDPTMPPVRVRQTDVE